jgi:hypothetical protein
VTAFNLLDRYERLREICFKSSALNTEAANRSETLVPLILTCTVPHKFVNANKNIKRRLLICNANIYFHKTCLAYKIIPKYANIKLNIIDKTAFFMLFYINILYFVLSFDRFYGLVVRVLGYRSGGPGTIPGTTRKKM